MEGLEGMRGGLAGPSPGPGRLGRGRCLKGDEEIRSQKKGPIDESLQPKIQLADDRIRWHRRNKLLKVSGWLGNRRAVLSEYLVDERNLVVKFISCSVTYSGPRK